MRARTTTGGLLASAVLVVASMITALPASAAHAVTAAPGEETTAAALLAGLPVRAEVGGEPGWTTWAGRDADGDGCTTRSEVAIAESRVPVVLAPPCSIQTAEWLTYHDGLTWTRVQDVDVRLLVEPAEAWQSGADVWPSSTRARYTEDIAVPETHEVITRSLGAVRGAADPAGWLPPLAGAHCRYAVSWVLVKHRWSLGVDPAERAALDSVLTGGCGQTVVTVPTKAPIDPPDPPAPPPAPLPEELLVGGTLVAGSGLTSFDGRYRAVVQGDGNVVVYSGARVLWQSRTAGSAGARLVLQTDGNLVVYSTAGRALFDTGTGGSDAARLVLQDDGNLVLRDRAGRPLWWTGGEDPHALGVGQTLRSGALLVSPDRRYSAVVQEDGNVVLYRGYRAVWQTGTGTSAGAGLVLQPDGNLVLYSSAGRALFDSRTGGTGATRLLLQDDGNLVLTTSAGRPVWSIGADTATLSEGESLSTGESLVSRDGRYRFLVQADGNAVVYAGARVLWHTCSAGNPGAELVMQSDGNLVLYAPGARAVWHSDTAQVDVRTITLQDDGALVLAGLTGDRRGSYGGDVVMPRPPCSG